MANIKIVTEIPGPRSKAWLERLSDVVPPSFSPALPIVAERGDGVLLRDLDGNTFLDMAGGIGALNVGHSHPKVVEAIRTQAERFTHTDFSLVPYASYIQLAEALSELAPIPPTNRVAFFNSGAEAVENAVKIARYATGRPAVICFEGAFHGRTLLALTLTSRVDPYKQGFGPFAPEVYRVPYPNTYLHPMPERAGSDALEALRRAFVTTVAPQSVAAIVVEPVQGEGGFVVPPKEFVTGLRKVADEYGIVLIVDEIQTGYGRTGRFFAIEHFDVQPDLMTIGKSIASGLPLSAVIGRADLMDAVPPGGLGGTTVGNPLACAAGLAVLQVIKEEGLVRRAEAIGRKLKECFASLAASVRPIGDVRGLGAMIGVEFVTDRETKAPDPNFARKCVKAMAERGVIALTSGLVSQVVRFLAPLVMTDDQLDEAVHVIRESLISLTSSTRS